jgi:hypothetical protein
VKDAGVVATLRCGRRFCKYTISTIYRNSRGGIQDAGLNTELLKQVAQCLSEEGNPSEALLTIEAVAKRSDDPEVRSTVTALRGYA